MYKDTGSKIKQRAESLSKLKVAWYIVLALLSIVLFFYFGTTIPLSEWPEWAPVWLPFVFIASSVYFISKAIHAWNEHLLLAGYGELIEETARTAAQLEAIKLILMGDPAQSKTTSEVAPDMEGWSDSLRARELLLQMQAKGEFSMMRRDANVKKHENDEK